MNDTSRTLLLLSAFVPFAACGGGGGGTAPLAPTNGFGPPEFASTGGANSRALLVADLDHDHVADVLVANETFASASWLKGRSDGSLAAGVLVPAPSLVASLVAADLDGDRVLDLVAASGASSEAVVLRGTGSGAFGPASPFPLPWAARKLVLVDWTGDGDCDLVAASAQTAEIALLPGDGAGSFGTAQIVPVGFAVADFAVVDLDGDRRPDFVCTGTGGSRIDTLRNDGLGGFLPAIQTTVPALAGRFVVGDLDGDWLADLVALEASTTAVRVFRGTGTGSFTSGPSRPVSSVPAQSLALGDLDADGRTDLVVAAGGQLLASHGDGTGALGDVSVLHSDGVGANWVAVSDLVGDGTADVLYVSGSDRVGVLRNNRATPTGLLSYGVGTPDCSGRIGMWANGSPRLGNAGFGYLTTNAPPNSLGVMLQGGPADITGSDPLGIGVLLHIGFGLVTTRLVLSDPQGQCFMADPVPSEPGLAGLPVYVQTLWQADLSRTCSASPGGYATSVGLTSTLQQ